MSYPQLIVAWHGSPVGHRCVNPYDPEADYPEYREDERRPVDALFDVSRMTSVSACWPPSTARCSKTAARSRARWSAGMRRWSARRGI
jgi:hypothetical protein